jgi:hypothetical protein
MAVPKSVSPECGRGEHKRCKRTTQTCGCSCHIPPATSPDALSRKCKVCGYIGFVGDQCPNGHGELTEPLYTSDGQLALIPVIRFSWNPGQSRNWVFPGRFGTVVADPVSPS